VTKTARFTDDYLPYLLVQACAQMTRPFHRALRGRGLLLPEWQVLASLYDREGQSLVELQQLCLVPQSNLSRIVTRMAKRGWVARIEAAGDRRRVAVTLTEAGRELARQLIADAKTQEAAATAHLSSQAITDLKTLLTGLMEKNG
jgi:DNA-binding MarR family transcriptional regulator